MSTTRTSAGLVLYRPAGGGRYRPTAGNEAGIEVLLGHLGGPLWARRDDGAWSIPNGEYDEDEAALDAARREFTEELGLPAPQGVPYRELGTIRQRNGKQVSAWAVAADVDVSVIVSNTFELEWPPRSGRRQQFPETDRAAWFDLDTARRKMVGGQNALLDRLVDLLA